MARRHYAVIWQQLGPSPEAPGHKYRCGHHHDTPISAHVCAAALNGRHRAEGVRVTTALYRIVYVTRTGRVCLVDTATAPGPHHGVSLVGGDAA